jgi:hypothetical protein
MVLPEAAQRQGQIGTTAAAAPQHGCRWALQPVAPAAGRAAYLPGQAGEAIAPTADGALFYGIGQGKGVQARLFWHGILGLGEAKLLIKTISCATTEGRMPQGTRRSKRYKCGLYRRPKPYHSTKC